jgi:hypothetical protein
MTVCAIILSGVATHTVLACSVPVFRYALERWEADSYEVTLSHRGSLSATEEAAAGTLKEAADQFAANFTFTDVDVSGPTNVPLPWLTAGFAPASAEGLMIAWQGPFTAQSGRALLDSPLRRELVRRLLAGSSIVWILLDGDPATTTMLQTELQRLQAEVVLPPVDPEDPRTAGNTNLIVAFSVLPVSRTDPAEQFLVSMLLNMHSGLDQVRGPVLIPVFGRGRMLAAFHGKDLNPAVIVDVVGFLCGPCACEIKAQNPGVDLLLTADWVGGLTKPVVVDPAMPPLVSLAAVAASAIEESAPPLPSAPPPEPEPDIGVRWHRSAAFAVLLMVIVVGIGAAFMMRRPKP